MQRVTINSIRPKFRVEHLLLPISDRSGILSEHQLSINRKLLFWQQELSRKNQLFWKHQAAM